jgi:hypothetical protein
MEKHVRILGWLYIVMGLIDVALGGLMFAMLSGVGAFSGDAHAFGMMSAIGGVMVTIFLIFSIPNFIVGLGFLKGWGGWVIVVACILSVINLMKFPWGTAVSIYTFWVAYKLSQAQDDGSVAGPTATA